MVHLADSQAGAGQVGVGTTIIVGRALPVGDAAGKDHVDNNEFNGYMERAIRAADQFEQDAGPRGVGIEVGGVLLSLGGCRPVPGAKRGLLQLQRAFGHDRAPDVQIKQLAAKQLAATS